MRLRLALASFLALAGPAHARGFGPPPAPPAVPTSPSFFGSVARAATKVLASFYGHGERLGRHTSDGEPFNPLALTCAHRTLPFGTRLAVTYAGQTIVVRVNDRGPAAYTGRALDLSYGAALRLGLVARGTALVTIAVLQ